MTAVAIELRRLTLAHLGDIEEIEQSAYPTPWSRTMFASELAKPTSICLGAFEGDQLVGYIINSRYVDAWHVMNVAVDPDHRRRGIATRLLEALFEMTERRRPPRLHARGARLEPGRDRPVRAPRLRAARRAPRLLHGQPRGRAVMWRDAAAGAVSPDDRGLILGIETSCDETAAALVTRDGEIRANVVASQAELHARYGGVVPGDRVAAAPRARHARAARGARRRPDASARRRRARSASRPGPGLIGALLVGLAAAKALAWARRLPLVPVNHLHGHVASLYLQPQNLEPPFTCLLASGGHTLLLDVRDRSWEGVRVLGTTLDDAAGEAFDKGARLLGLGYPGGAEIDRLAREGDPEAYAFPVARVPGLDFSFSGLKTALLYAVRDLAPDGARGTARRPRRELPARDRAGARRADRGCAAPTPSRSSAAWPPTPSCAPRCRTPSLRR